MGAQMHCPLPFVSHGSPDPHLPQQAQGKGLEWAAGAQTHPLSSSRLGCNALGDPTALGLARGLPPYLRVLQ